MTFSRWFRIIWWVVLLALLLVYLGERYLGLHRGQVLPVGLVPFLATWLILAIVPLILTRRFEKWTRAGSPKSDRPESGESAPPLSDEE